MAVSGTLRVTLAPLLPEIPGFGAATVSMMTPPVIKYFLDFGAAFGGSYSARAIQGWLDPFIRDTIGGMLVWPRRLLVPILDEAVTGPLDELRLRHKGALQVDVLEARGLPKMDAIGSADPYVEIYTTDPHVRSSADHQCSGRTLGYTAGANSSTHLNFEFQRRTFSFLLSRTPALSDRPIVPSACAGCGEDQREEEHAGALLGRAPVAAGAGAADPARARHRQRCRPGQRQGALQVSAAAGADSTIASAGSGRHVLRAALHAPQPRALPSLPAAAPARSQRRAAAPFAYSKPCVLTAS
jgi:hypothetical protein